MLATFLPPQSSTTPSTPLPYTSSPWKLVWEDIRLFFRCAWSIPGVVFPLKPYNSGPLDELYPSPGNLGNAVLQLVLSLLQLIFLLSLPVCLICTVPPFLILFYMAIFLLMNKGVCDLILNRRASVLVSRVPEYVAPEHKHEHWIFINGVAVGKRWLQSSIDRLGYTFGRKVTGLHNLTTGLVFDIIQCLIQRCFSYPTQDVRDAYAATRAALLDPGYTKVVLIAHSQGGIEAGLIADWLLAEIPQGLLRKLEIYTFGNAANHFNNPYRALPETTSTTQIDPGHSASHPDPRTLALITSEGTEYNNTILHIEHYANLKDFVSLWGVLEFSNIQNRFMGRVFVRPGSGHMFNQHYMDTMFTLGADRRVLDSNDFMDMEIDVPGSAGTEGRFSSLMDRDGEPRLTVKDLSRLWLYRNGGSPRDDR